MKLREVLSLDRKVLIDIKDNEEYSIAGVQSYGKGIVIRRNVFGNELNMKKYKLIKENQLMWCKVDTKNGAFGITKKEHIGSLASTNMALADIDLKKASPEFIQIFFSMKPFYKHINSLSTGTTNRKYLTPDQVLDLIEIPLMSRLDQDIFMKKLTLFKNKIIEFDIIQDKNENYISKLRQQILQEAVQGKLVPQNSKDEPASELLKKIQKEKEKLIKEGKMKKQKPLPPISDDEIPYELPKSWEWVRLGDLSASENYSFVDGPFGSNLKREHYVEKGIRIIQLQNVGEGFWKEGKNVYTSENKANELIRCNAYPGDLVIAKMAPVARATIIPGLHKKYVLCSDCVKFKPHKLININYIRGLLNSEIIRKRVILDSTGMTRQRTSLGKLKLLTIPLPPLSEQLRIVEKIDKLMVYCDELEKQVKENQGNSEKLMISVLKESFSNKE